MLLTRANTIDLISLLQASGELTVGRRHYGQLLAQVSFSEAYAVYEAAASRRPLSVAGIAPLPNGAGEIWFGVRAGGLDEWLLPIVRRARLVLRARASGYPGGLMCLVKDGHEPGERLARLIGCVPQNVALGECREWVWRADRVIYGGGRQQQGAAATGSGATGADY